MFNNKEDNLARGCDNSKHVCVPSQSYQIHRASIKAPKEEIDSDTIIT